MKTPHRPLVVFDVETTGFKPEEGHAIVEIAAERIEGRRVVAAWETLVNPGVPLTDEAMRFLGITNEDLRASGKPPAEALAEFLGFAHDAILVGHNVQFDIGFVNAHLMRLGWGAIQRDTLDTWELAKRYLILPSYSLASVARYLKIPQPMKHRAAADVATTRAVLIRLIERAKGSRA